jgi:hypothetical protein
MFDHLNNTSSPAFVMNVQVKNDGPHGIPHG